MIIETFAVGPLQCNCTILGDEHSREAIVIDPGGEPDKIFQALEKHSLTVKQIVCTHTHIDHVGAIAELQQRFESSASIHESDLFLYEKLDVQAQWIGLPEPRRGTIDRFIKDGDAVGCNGVQIGVLHTPGHTPGSITFHLPADRATLFTGDTLFLQSIGRTDLWGGSYPQIIQSIQNKLLTFGDETLVIPGHGQWTTIGRERRNNPFLQ